MEQSSSQYRVVSIGYVVENKSRNSDEIEVWLNEKLPFVNGELAGGFEEANVTASTPTGEVKSFAVKMSNSIMAGWVGDGSNRISSPDVRRGDKVEVLQYGDVDQYFWRVFNEPGKNVRRRETVVHAYSNTQDESQTTQTPENSWYSEVNTHDKVATLMRTNKSDGEKFAYDVSVDVKAGKAQMADDVGNGVVVNSDECNVGIENSTGSFIRVVKDTAIIKANKLIIESSQGQVSVPITTWKGDINLSGNLSLTGNMVGSASGTYTFNGNVITTAGIMNKGKNIGAGHGHSGVQPGGGNSGSVT